MGIATPSAARRRRLLLPAAALGVSGLLLTACGAPPEQSEASGSGAAESEAIATVDGVGSDNKDYKACIVSDEGGFDDRSFNQSSYEGLKAAEEAYGITTSEAESNEPSEYTPNVTAMVNGDCDAVIGVGFLLGDAMKPIAAQHSDTHFFGVDVTDGDFTDNFQKLTYDTAQAAFLAGYLAAGTTETGTVATYGGMEIPTVTIFMDGFARGVEHYNEVKDKDVKVLGWDKDAKTGSFTGDFENVANGKTNTANFINEGADIVMPVAGPVGLGTLDAVREANQGGKDVKVIWPDSDGYESTKDGNLILTSVKKNMGQSVADVIAADLKDEFSAEPYVGTLENKGVHVLLGRVEAAHPAHLAARRVPVVEPEAGAQPVGHALGQDGEHGVGVRGLRELDAGQRAVGDPRLDAGAQPGGHGVGVAGGAQVQVAVEQREQLRRDEAHLRGQLHLVLAQVHEAVRGVRVEHDDGLGQQRPVLGAAEGEHVHADVGGEGAQRQAQGGRGVGDAGAVHVDAHPVLVGVVRDGLDLVRGVDRAELGGLGEVDDQGLGTVLVAPAPRLGGDQLGGELAVVGGHGQQLDAGGLLGRAALVHVDVRGVRADHRAPAGQHGLEPDDVRPGAVEHRPHGGVLAEVLGHDLLEAGRVHVLAVGDLVAPVGLGDRREHLRVDAGVVVRGEAPLLRIVDPLHVSYVPFSWSVRTASFSAPASASHSRAYSSASRSSSPARDFTRNTTAAERSGASASRAALAQPCATARVHASLAAFTAA